MTFSPPRPIRLAHAETIRRQFALVPVQPAPTPGYKYACKAFGGVVQGDMCLADDQAVDPQGPCPPQGDSPTMRNQLTGQCVPGEEAIALAQAYDACAQQRGVWDEASASCKADSMSGMAGDTKDEKKSSNTGLVVAAVVGVAVVGGLLFANSQKNDRAIAST